jgi:hypothetical protein
MLLRILRFPEHSALFHKSRVTFSIYRIYRKLLIFCGSRLVLPSSDNLRSSHIIRICANLAM